MLSLILLQISHPAKSDEAKKLELCDKDVKACLVVASDLEALAASQKDEITKLIKQRDAAIKSLEGQGPAFPWYFWTVLGAAGGIVLVRGFK